MDAGHLVTLKCAPETLRALASGLTRFGRSDGEPEWLVSGVWLCAGEDCFLATASVEVLSSGYVARTLCIGRPGDLAQYLDSELPNVADRLLTHGNGLTLPAAEPPRVPESLSECAAGAFHMQVLIRVSERASAVHHVACALLFCGRDNAQLLVGTDISSLAMVLSEDSALIAHYREDCEALTADDYLDRAGS